MREATEGKIVGFEQGLGAASEDLKLQRREGDVLDVQVGQGTILEYHQTTLGGRSRVFRGYGTC